MQPKKSFAYVNYDICNPKKCDPENGKCVSVAACSHKVLNQLDGPFNPPVAFHEMCMACWDCIEACPINAIEMKHLTS